MSQGWRGGSKFNGKNTGASYMPSMALGSAHREMREPYAQPPKNPDSEKAVWKGNSAAPLICLRLAQASVLPSQQPQKGGIMIISVSHTRKLRLRELNDMLRVKQPAGWIGIWTQVYVSQYRWSYFHMERAHLWFSLQPRSLQTFRVPLFQCHSTPRK